MLILNVHIANHLIKYLERKSKSNNEGQLTRIFCKSFVLKFQKTFCKEDFFVLDQRIRKS